MADHIRESVGEFIVSNPGSGNRIAVFALSAAVIVLSAFIGYLQLTKDIPSKQEQQFEQVQKEDAMLLKEIKENFDPPDPNKVTEMNAKVDGMRYIPSGPVVIGVYACFVNFCSCRFVKQLQGTRDLQDLVVVLTVRQLRAVKHVIKTTTSRGHNLAILRPGHPAAPWKTM